jgi:hypothetical protein
MSAARPPMKSGKRSAYPTGSAFPLSAGIPIANSRTAADRKWRRLWRSSCLGTRTQIRISHGARTIPIFAGGLPGAHRSCRINPDVRHWGVKGRTEGKINYPELRCIWSRIQDAASCAYPVFTACRNTEDEPGNKQVGTIYFYVNPMTNALHFFFVADTVGQRNNALELSGQSAGQRYRLTCDGLFHLFEGAALNALTAYGQAHHALQKKKTEK